MNAMAWGAVILPVEHCESRKTSKSRKQKVPELSATAGKTAISDPVVLGGSNGTPGGLFCLIPNT